MDLEKSTILNLHESLKKKEISSVELTRRYLSNIDKKDEKINAFLNVTQDLALDLANKADKIISSSSDFPILTGIPCAIKDNIMVQGLKCTAGSKILKNYIAPYDATCIRKIKENGAVILGKTNLDEFAMGSSTENSAFFVTKNPLDLQRVPGGSSGGSAAAVAASFSPFALGSDTGGSVRQPASLCGIVGFKPSYGAVSRYGLIAFASSLDQIGTLTKSAEDAKIIFKVIRGQDKLDSTSLESKKSSPLQIKKLKVGIPKEYFVKGMDKEVELKVREGIKRFEKLGADIVDVSLPNTSFALPIYYIISPSEASANLARYDGIKYGLSKAEGKDLLNVYLDTREEGFGKEVKRRIMLGTYVLSSGYYDAYYAKAEKVRAKIIEDFEKAFAKVDLLLTPTSPTTAFKIGEKADDPLQMYLSDIYTVPVNLAGLPAVSLPCGNVNNLPVGLQIIGKYLDDDRVLEAASIFEKNE